MTLRRRGMGHLEANDYVGPRFMSRKEYRMIYMKLTTASTSESNSGVEGTVLATKPQVGQ